MVVVHVQCVLMYCVWWWRCDKCFQVLWCAGCSDGGACDQGGRWFVAGVEGIWISGVNSHTHLSMDQKHDIVKMSCCSCCGDTDDGLTFVKGQDLSRLG